MNTTKAVHGRTTRDAPRRLRSNRRAAFCDGAETICVQQNCGANLLRTCVVDRADVSLLHTNERRRWRVNASHVMRNLWERKNRRTGARWLCRILAIDDRRGLLDARGPTAA